MVPVASTQKRGWSNIVSTLLLVPLDDIVVFPNMNVTVAADVGDEERVLLVPRHDGEYATVGTVAEVADQVRLPGGGRAVNLVGLHRATAGAAHTDGQGRLRVDVEEGAQRQQREYILRKQLESIRKELGEDDASVSDDYRTKIAEAGMPDAVREQAEREVARLERMGDQSGESSMIRTYLDWLLAVPWGKRSEERLDPLHAREVLDADHAGLQDVKERIVEYLAVRKLRQERGIAEDKRSGAILTLIGPPGTGKTSVGESIARALNREFVRMSLGGVRDEAEIRGHRRTYVGALPGRLVRALRDAGTMNPV